jgi:WD40 repeat protein
MRVWDLASGLCRASLAGHTNRVNSVAVSADGRTAVSGSNDNTVRVWDLDSGLCRASLEDHSGNVLSVALSADGRTAVSGSNDNTVRVWDLVSGLCRSTLEGPSEEISCVAVSEDGRTAVSLSWDKTVRVWDLATGLCRAGHPADSPEAQHAWMSIRCSWSLFAKCTPLFLEVAAGSAEVFARFPGCFGSAQCSEDGQHVVAGGSRGQVYLFRLRRWGD